MTGTSAFSQSQSSSRVTRSSEKRITRIVSVLSEVKLGHEIDPGHSIQTRGSRRRGRRCRLRDRRNGRLASPTLLSLFIPSPRPLTNPRPVPTPRSKSSDPVSPSLLERLARQLHVVLIPGSRVEESFALTGALVGSVLARLAWSMLARLAGVLLALLVLTMLAVLASGCCSHGSPCLCSLCSPLDGARSARLRLLAGARL